MPKVSQMLESKYLKKDDVGEDGTVCTVKSFARTNVAQEGEPPEHKWLMGFEELEKPMVLNSTNIQLCEKIFSSDDTDDWLGKQLIVYSDPNISFGGKIVGGIRVRAYRKNGQPRHPAGDDFGDAPSASAIAVKEQEMVDAAGYGLDALKSAWGGLTEDERGALRSKLDSFKAIASNPKPAAVDKLDEDIPF